MEVDLQRGGRGGAYAPPQQASHRDWLAGSLVFAGEAFEAGDSSDVGAEHSLLRLLDPPTYTTQPPTPRQQPELNPASARLLLETGLSSASDLDSPF